MPTRPGRGKEAMDSTGILPAYTGTVVSDGLCASRRYRESRHGLCGAHLLRELTYIKETCAEQQQWTEPLAKLLLEIKAAGEKVRFGGGRELSEEQREKFFGRYDRLVARGETETHRYLEGRRRLRAYPRQRWRSRRGARARLRCRRSG